MKSKTQPSHPRERDYSKYPFLNFSLNPMEGEEWKDIPQFEGFYSISNYGRVWAAQRPINTITGRTYYTKERIRKQCITKHYNSYTKEYTEQLNIRLRYEQKSYGFKVSRLVYEFFVGPLNDSEDALLVIHKDGDNCNNRYDNLLLMNGTELYGHRLSMDHIPRTGQIIKRGKQLWSEKNAPRPIVQYSLDGRKLNEYESIEQAASENKVNRSSITSVARQKLIQLHGLVYRFKATPYYGEHADFAFEKIVTQYALNGKRIKSYPSVKEAGRSVGADPNSISKCALKKSMTCCGFVWRYERDSYSGAYKGKIKNKPLPITQYNLNGTKVASFDSVNEASRVTGFIAASILDCAHRKSKVAYGFVWRFKNEPYTGEHEQYRRGKPVTRYTREGKKIDSYPTIEAAAKATGLTPDNIQKNVNGSNKTAGGFVWKLATEEERQKMPIVSAKNTNTSDRKEVVQYSVEGKKVNVFRSITEAARVCNIAVSTISSSLNKPTRTAAGFVWRTKGNRYRGALAKTPAANKSCTVTQYDLTGAKLNVYKSTREAGKITGISASTISVVARGKLKSTGGFIWRYGDGPAQIDIQEHFASTEEHVKRISKPVLKYSLAGEFIKEYSSILAAGREEGIDAVRISSVINGHTKSAGGDLWRLKGDELNSERD